MKITLDLKGTSASAITTTLEERRKELRNELEGIEAALRQLRAFDVMPKPERGEDRLRHGEALEAIHTYLMTVTAPWGAPIEQIMNDLKIPRTSAYRALKKLQEDRKIVLATNRHWVGLAFPGMEAGNVMDDLPEDEIPGNGPPDNIHYDGSSLPESAADFASLTDSQKKGSVKPAR